MYIFLYTCVYSFTILKTKGKYKHRGEVLQAVVNKNSTNITQLVKRMGISRGTYYNHIQDPDLPFDLLERYGKILDYDFTNDFTEMHKYTLEEPSAPYGEPSTLEEAIKQRDYWRSQTDHWKNKYIQLLEEKGK